MSREAETPMGSKVAALKIWTHSCKQNCSDKKYQHSFWMRTINNSWPCNCECRISSDKKWMERKRYRAEYTTLRSATIRELLLKWFPACTDIILSKKNINFTLYWFILISDPSFQTKHNIYRIWSLFVSTFSVLHDSFGQLANLPNTRLFWLLRQILPKFGITPGNVNNSFDSWLW